MEPTGATFANKIAVVTGAGGAIGGEIAQALTENGARVAIWDLSLEAAQRQCAQIDPHGVGTAIAVHCDATCGTSVAQALTTTIKHYDTVDFLVNAAGGSHPTTTTSTELEFFDIQPEAVRMVMDLNYLSAVIPCQAIGRVFAQNNSGVILNISSIGGELPLSRAMAYSNGKAAADSFTRWLAIHMAQTYSATIRVNAIAPGFMVTEQNRFLLVEGGEDRLTERARTILANVPMGRFGNPNEIVGAALWILSEQASFVTGAVIPVDGGFSAFCGV